MVADLVDVTRLHTADPHHRVPHLAFQPDQLADTPILPMDEVRTAYYLRLRAFDRPGVLADITRILADGNISIDAMVQKEPAEGEARSTSSCSPTSRWKRTSTRRSPASRRSTRWQGR